MSIEIIDDDERIEHWIGDARLTLRRIPAAAHAGIVRTHTVRRKTGGEWVTEIDNSAVLLDCIDYTIVDWMGVVHPVTKSAVPCTCKYKRSLPISVMQAVMDLLADAEDTATQRHEAELKNSNGSSA